MVCKVMKNECFETTKYMSLNLGGGVVVVSGYRLGLGKIVAYSETIPGSSTH